MFSKKTVKDVAVKNKVILLRTDYNVPMGSTSTITDDFRIRASLPTIEYLLGQKAAKIIIVSHLGRPAGRTDKTLSLAGVALRLGELLPTATVRFVAENSGPEVEQAVDGMPKGSILLLENLRFSTGEEKNSEDFASEIVASTHPDLFVQDGFGVVHRAHASTDAITRLLPSIAGLLLEKEVTALLSATESPRRPLLLILGGAKVADKQPLIDRFTDLADHITIGGKIAAEMTSSSDQIFISTLMPSGLDIDPPSTGKILGFISTSQTIIWNGLTGKAEDPDFAASSTTIAEAIGQRAGTTSIICGGDTSGFVQNLTKTNPSLAYTLISTGGGASLELLLGLPLPGLESLEDK